MGELTEELRTWSEGLATSGKPIQANLLRAAADELASLRSSVAQLEAELALARAVAEAAWDSPGKHYNAQLMLALAAWRGGSK